MYFQAHIYGVCIICHPPHSLLHCAGEAECGVLSMECRLYCGECHMTVNSAVIMEGILDASYEYDMAVSLAMRFVTYSSKQ